MQVKEIYSVHDLFISAYYS